MTHAINVNEISIFKFWWLVLRRADVYLLAVDPLFPPLQPLLDRLTRVGRAGAVPRVVSLFPEIDRIRGNNHQLVYLYNIFAETEAWQRVRFAFNSAGHSLPDYATAYKHVTCNYLSFRQITMLLLRACAEQGQTLSIRIHGLLDDVRAGAEAYAGLEMRDMAPPMALPWPLLNFVVALGTMLYGVAWVTSRTRVRVQTENVFFAADWVGDVRDARIYREVAEGGPVLIVKRSRAIRSPEEAGVTTWRSAWMHDGRFAPMQALAAIAMILRDGWRLFTAFKTLETPHFYSVAVLPYRRAVLRGFFNRFKCRNFWGRDDYNVEHVLRRQEIHRIGGRSLGINHGSPTMAIRQPMWAYVDFDCYYVFGRAIYEDYCHTTWAKDMDVVPVGTFGASREDYAAMAALTAQAPRRDIAVMASVFTGNEKIVAITRALATSFPQRRIWLQIKPLFATGPRAERFIADCTRDLPNVVFTADPMFKLFSRVDYIFSDPSTVVIEAIQFGLYAWAMDVEPTHRALIYRDYPGLCLSAGAEAVARVKEIENGQPYPRRQYGRLVDLSGRTIFDVIRENVGLPAKPAPTPCSERTA